MRYFFSSKNLFVLKCCSCFSLTADHIKLKRNGNPWLQGSLSTNFLLALSKRRAEQARIIIASFYDIFKGKKILDYGCGQGIFTELAIESGLNCMGCDIYVSQENPLVNQGHFIMIKNETEILNNNHLFDIIVLLDVIEHMDDPSSFLKKMYNANIQTLVIKTPINSGPIGIFSMILVKFSLYQMIERLFLVGEPHPHKIYFSIKGLVILARRSGYILRHRIPVADVGWELPHRMYLGSGRVFPLFFNFIGRCIEFFSRIWSDSYVFVFDKNK